MAKLQVRDIQQREEHWALVDLMGKGRHIRTVPVPDWVKAAVDEWTKAAGIADGQVFRCVSRTASIWGNGITEKVVWHIVKDCAKRAEFNNSHLTIVAARAPVYATRREESLSRSNSFSVTFRWKRRSGTSGVSSGCDMRSMIRSGSNRNADPRRPRRFFRKRLLSTIMIWDGTSDLLSVSKCYEFRFCPRRAAFQE